MGGPAYITAMKLGKTATLLLSRTGGGIFAGIAQPRFEFVLYGLVPVALLWLGVGVALVAPRIKETNRRLLLAAGCYAVLPVMLMVILPELVFFEVWLNGDQQVWVGPFRAFDRGVETGLLVFSAFVPIWLGGATVLLSNRIRKSIKRD